MFEQQIEYIRVLVAAIALVLVAVKIWQFTYYWADYRRVHDRLRRAKLVEIVGSVFVFVTIAVGSLVTLFQHQPVTWRAFALAGGMLLQARGLYTLTYKERHVLREWDKARGRGR